MKAMSSTCSARCGKISDTQAPDWPCRVNWNGDFISPPISPGKKAGLGIEAFQRLAVAFFQLGLVVPGVDLALAAVHEQPDDALGLGRKMRRPRGQRIERQVARGTARRS